MMVREWIVRQACQRHNFISRRLLLHRHHPPLLLLVRHQPRHHLRLDNNLHQLKGTNFRVSIRVAVVVNSHPPLPSVRHQPHRWIIQVQIRLLEVMDLEWGLNLRSLLPQVLHRQRLVRLEVEGINNDLPFNNNQNIKSIWCNPCSSAATTFSNTTSTFSHSAKIKSIWCLWLLRSSCHRICTDSTNFNVIRLNTVSFRGSTTTTDIYIWIEPLHQVHAEVSNNNNDN